MRRYFYTTEESDMNKVVAFFTAQHMEDKIQEFTESSATVELAAQAIGCKPERIAKTLSFSLPGKSVLIVAAGDAKIDNPKYKAQFGAKAAMLTAEEALERVGHAIGGVCPFVLKENVEVYLDISLRRFQTVFTACGSSNTVIELTIAELEKFSGYFAWIDVCKNWDTAITD